MKSVRDAEVRNKKVFLRVDYNVPMEVGKIVDDNRIKATISTIKYLLDKEASIIIGTHIGRPNGKVDLTFSTLPMAERLSELLGKAVIGSDFVVDNADVAKRISELKPKEILMLGNLRFHPEEEANEDGFAKKLAAYADIYVNDAFAVSHRANASVEAITKFIPSYAGLLLESEITSLSLLMQQPAPPFVLVIGGAKIKDKAGMIKNLAEKAEKVLVGGAVANTFLKAKGEDVSESLIEEEMLEDCKKMIAELGDKLELPIDNEKKDLGDDKFQILDIGPSTQGKFRSEILNANSIFWNGNMGYSEEPDFAKGTEAVASAIADNSFGTKVAAGGDTVGFLDQYNLASKFSFVSTGGGAALEFLAGQKLPGVEALKRAKP